jgi:sn-glycerol 3-phosphate transport system ATP-binding protein
MAEIRLRDIHKSFGSNEVIHGVDWHIEDGEFVVIVGPSGCGKSTLLRMIAGLESITSGEIAIDERVVNDLEPAERDIAMVFQNYALYPHMSVYNNMAYGLKIRGMSKTEIETRVHRAADILELGEFLKRSPRQLSGGQRQRVAMGRAIVREPSVFLFDEPLSNLDAKLRVQMRLEIKKLQAGLKITSVYVTHDQVEAMTLGHRLLVLNAGYVEQLGTPIELYEKPASIFVAGFIGSPSMNVLAGQVNSEGTAVDLPGGDILPLPGTFSSHAKRPVTLGMRPEHLRVTGDGDGLVEQTVQVVEQLGADTLVHGQFGATGADMTIRLNGIVQMEEGDTLPLAIDPENMHLFDAETGARIEEI